MALGSNQQTITTGDVFLPEVWSRETQRATEAALVLTNLVTRMDEDVADGGDKIHRPKVSNITAYAKAANTQVTLNAPTESEFTMNIDRHFESSYLVEDRLKVQSKYDILDQYSGKAGYAIGQKMDSDLAGLYTSLTQSVGNSTTDLAISSIARGLQFLDDANAPQSERVLVIKPAGLNHFRNIGEFMRYDATGRMPGALVSGGLPTRDGVVEQIGKNGFVGRIFNLDVYMTTNLVEEAGTSDVVHNLMFHKEAFAMAVQLKPRMQFQYKQEYLGTLATTDALWGYGVYRSEFAVDVRSDDE